MPSTKLLRTLVRNGFIAAVLATLSAGCHQSSSIASDDMGVSAGGDTMASSAAAALVVERARRIHVAPLPDKLRLSNHRLAADARSAGDARSAMARSLIVASTAEARVVGATIRANLTAGKPAAMKVAYPMRAPQARVLELPSGAALSLALRDATDATAEYANGYIVYRRGTRAGADMIVRPSQNGFEDYFLFENKPANRLIEYDVALPPAVAGLRLSSNILEMVDVNGAPLLHVSPPLLVDSAGKTTTAKISIAGCAYDPSTQPAWHRKPTAPGATSCRVSIAWDDATVQYPALLDPAWETAAAMPIASIFFNTEVLAGRSPQQIVVFGFQDNTSAQNTTLFFDVDSGTWSAGPPTVLARPGGTSVSFNNSKTNDGAQIFVSGGYSQGSDGQWNLETSTEILSLDANGQWAWKASSPMKAARYSHTATAIPTATGAQILLAGGYGAGPYANGCDGGPTAVTAELYDTASGTFVSPAPPNLPAPLWGATANLAPDGQTVIIMSGFNGGVDQPGGLCSGNSMVFAFRGGQWLTLPSLPSYRIAPQVVRLNDGRLLATGGGGYTDATQQTCTQKMDSDIFTFSPAAPYGSWATTDPMPSPSIGLLATLPNGAVMFAGLGTGASCDTPPAPVTEVDFFDPTTGHWSRTSDATVAHYGGGLESVAKSTGEHEAVLFGGTIAFDADGRTYTAATETFTLAPVGGSCNVGPECANGNCLGSLCQPPGFAITIDATALSNKGASIPGVLNGAVFDTTQPRPISLAAGTYNLQTVAGVASVATFVVTSAGTIDYDPSLEGVLGGRGGTTLKVNGRAITVDATHLTQPQLQLVVDHFSQGAEVDLLSLPTSAPQGLVLLPLAGYGYQFNPDSGLAALAFGLDLAGNVHIPPEDAYLATGEGTPRLTITGTKISITMPAGLGDGTIGNIALPTGKTTDVFLLPAPGTPLTIKFGDQTATISVDASGNVLGNPALISILDIHGNGPSACGAQNSDGAENGWNATPLMCGGGTVEDGDGIEAATAAVTPLSRLGTGRFPNELPRFRKLAGGDPVLGDGEFSIQRTDFAFGGTGMHYEFTRSYRSGLELDTPLGSGWDHNYDQRVLGKVVFNPYDDKQLPFAGDVIAPYCDGSVQVQDGTGNVVLFNSRGWFYIVPPSTIYYPGTTTEYVGPYQHFTNQTNELTLDYFPSLSDGKSFWIMRRNDSSLVTVFDTAGFLYSITNAAGNSITFEWERASAAPYPDCTNRTQQQCASDVASWRNKLTRTPVGQQRRLLDATDPYRRIFYRYSTTAISPSSPLTCITQVQSDTDCSYPLVSFLWTNGRFTGVTHGDPTTQVIESYRYHPAATDANCLASADIPKYCTRLCASPSVDCLGGDYQSQVLNRCPNLTCTPLAPRQPCLASHRIYKGDKVSGPAMCCNEEPADDPSICINFMFGGPNCHDGCEYTNQCTQLRNDSVTAVYAAGSGKELNNDITDVFDSKGALVVHNDYGEDISTVSFDKVVTQTMTSSSTDNVVKFEYHDLALEKGNGIGPVYVDPAGTVVASTTPYSVADPRIVQYELQDGVAINLCPRVCPDGSPSCTAYDYGRAIFTEPQPHPFDMKSATVIHDLHNITRVQFLDQYTDIIREVVLESNEVTDYNYENPNGAGPGLLVGVRDASGVRTCLERDAQGRVVQSSRVAAPGYAGSTPTQATTYAYDFGGQLTDVFKDALATRVWTHYVRDAYERVLSIDQDVGGGKPKLHTAYKYDSEPPPVVRLNRLESPSSITYPNGRVDTFTRFDLSGGGVDNIVIDSGAALHGGVPEQRYVKYDSIGRVREEGELHRFAKQYYYDAGDDIYRLSGYAHRDNDASPWITTTVQSHVVDGETVVDALIEPTRTTTFTTVGRYVTQKTLTGTVAPAGTQLPAPQTSCENHSADGRVEETIQPEGNGVVYTYPTPDPSGHTVRMQRGFGVPASDAWAQGCSGNTAPAGDPMLSAPWGTHYLPGGFIDTEVDQQLRTRKYTTDGFGRVIQIEAVANPKHADAVPVQRFGYDSKDNRIWEATYKPETTLASDPYGTPNLNDPSLLSYSATEYDLQGRVTKKHQYVLETGDDLVQSWDRNDQTSLTVTTDRTSSETMQYDYRGRLLQEVRPDQSTRSIVHGLGVDTITTQLNQGGSITRVYNYDTRGRLSNVVDDRGAANPLYAASYDDDGNKLTEQKRGLGQLTYKFDSFGRLVEEDRVLGGAAVATTHEYDRNNRRTATVDGEKHRWQMTFTGTDAPLTVTDPLQRVGTYTYIAGWPQSLAATKRDPNGRITSFTYDSEARPLDVYNGDCGSGRDPWTCSVGTLVSQRHTIYDERGEVKEIDGGPANPTPVLYTYDSLGRVASESVGTETVVSHPFTDLGFTQTTQITHGAWSATMKHKFDTSNRLHTVEVAGQAQPVVATYDFGQGTGGPLTLSYANGTTAKYQYDNMLRQIGVDVGFTPPGGTTALPVASLHQAFGPDSIARLRQFQFAGDPALTNVFEVDTDGRLAAENLNLPGITLPAGEIDNSGVDLYMQKRGPAWRQYTLDNIDNVKQRTTQQKTVLSNTIFAMDALSRLTSVGNKVVTHDARDNVDVAGTQDPVTFAFDAFTGTMTTAKAATGTTKYHYDALGRRLSATPPHGADVMYIWDGDKLVGHGPETAIVLDVPGADIDAHIVSIDQFGAGKSRRFYHQASDQSTIALSDDNGFVEGYSYSAFGEASVWMRSGSPPTDNIFRYQGQVFDIASGTYAMRARQYRPDWGRFVSPDPLSTAGGASLYAFTSSRPLSYRDPTGLLMVSGAGVSEQWLRAWMSSWDTPFGTPAWEGGFGGGGLELAERYSFGSGMGDMASLWYDPNSPVFGPEFPGMNDALMTRKILAAIATPTTDADGFPLGLNDSSGITNEELLLGANAPPGSVLDNPTALAQAYENYSLGYSAFFGMTTGFYVTQDGRMYPYILMGGATPGLSLAMTRGEGEPPVGSMVYSAQASLIGSVSYGGAPGDGVPGGKPDRYGWETGWGWGLFSFEWGYVGATDVMKARLFNPQPAVDPNAWMDGGMSYDPRTYCSGENSCR